MYAAIWRALPGPTWLRVIQVAILIAVVVLVLFTWVFPAIAPYMPFYESEVTVG
ncbi:MAG TPA: hypothetical protein VFC82_11250 [Actinomycetaceae bacterium]|nr:hypothetical protein [Actinomycetaceae bacterium]